jgi:hypothetical protein
MHSFGKSKIQTCVPIYFTIWKCVLTEIVAGHRKSYDLTGGNERNLICNDL